MRYQVGIKRLFGRIRWNVMTLVVAGAVLGLAGVACFETEDESSERSSRQEDRFEQPARESVFETPVDDRADTHSSQGFSGTGVFVNGFELGARELMELEYILQSQIYPGYYWLDAQGNYGYEGGSALGNLYYGQSGGGYIERNQGGYLGSDGQTSYYFDPQTGCSVIPGEGLSC